MFYLLDHNSHTKPSVNPINGSSPGTVLDQGQQSGRPTWLASPPSHLLSSQWRSQHLGVALPLLPTLTTTLERSMGGSLGFSGFSGGIGTASGALAFAAMDPGFGTAGLVAGLAGGGTGRFTGASFLGGMLLCVSYWEKSSRASAGGSRICSSGWLCPVAA